jgi:hypothetical protein
VKHRKMLVVVLPHSGGGCPLRLLSNAACSGYEACARAGLWSSFQAPPCGS